MHFRILLLFTGLIFISDLKASEDELQNRFPTQLIEDAKTYANTGGNILKKPCAFAGAIPGATVGLISSIPIAFAASAIVPVIHLGSGNLIEAGKSMLTAPINMLYLGGVTGANWGMLVAGSSGFLAGVGLGTVTAVAKNIVTYSSGFSSGITNNNGSATLSTPIEDKEVFVTQNKYISKIKNNPYLNQCEQALTDFMDRKTSDSNDKLIIQQDWEYTVALAHDCLRDQYQCFINSEEYENLGNKLYEQELKIKSCIRKIENLNSRLFNTRKRIKLYGENPRLEGTLEKNSKYLLREESLYRELLVSLEETRKKIKQTIYLEEDIIYFRNILLEELKNSGIDQSRLWPNPRYMNI